MRRGYITIRFRMHRQKPFSSISYTLVPMNKDTVYIYGRHAVNQALERKPGCVSELLFQKGMAQLTPAAEKSASDNHIKRHVLDMNKLPKDIPEDAIHQGMVALVNPRKVTDSLDHFMEHTEINAGTAVVLLGEIQDPQNVGSIIRSAAAMGISAVLVPEHNQSPINGTVVKVSAGMAFSIPIIEIGNVNNAIEKLKKSGFWVYGLDGNSDKKIQEETFDAPTVFVVGNEGEGIRVKTKEACDVLLAIPMDERCESLNAGVSTAMAMYEWRRGRVK